MGQTSFPPSAILTSGVPTSEPVAPGVWWLNSGVLTLSQGVPPTIDTQPQATSVSPDETATFTVSATNATSYQWQLDSGSGFANISGATADSYTTPTLTVSEDGNQYRVVVTGPGGSTTSDAVVLTVILPASLVFANLIDTERDDAGNTAMTAAAVEVIRGMHDHLNGVANAWSTANGVSPIDIWDNIVFWTDFSSKANIGTGTNMLAYVAPDSTTTVSECTITGSMINGQAYDSRSDPSSDHRIEFPLLKYPLPHTLTLIWVGQRPTNTAAGPIYTVQEFYESRGAYSHFTSGNGFTMLSRSTEGVGQLDRFGESNNGQIFNNRPGPAINYVDEGTIGLHRVTNTVTDPYTYTPGDTVEADLLLMSAYVTADVNSTTATTDTNALHGQILIVKEVLTATQARDLAQAMMAASNQLICSESSSFVIQSTVVEGDGSTTYSIASSKIGFARIRVKEPSSPVGGKPHRYCHVLQATEPVSYASTGDGFDIAVTEGYDDDYNMTLISVDWEASPWYADHDTYTVQQHEDFFLNELIPWCEANFGTSGDEHVAVGFSKSANGGLSMLFRNPSVFQAVAAFDGPMNMANMSDEASLTAEMTTAYGSETNFDNYNLNTLAAASTDFDSGDSRIWLGYATGAAPNNGRWDARTTAFSTVLTNAGVVHNLVDVGSSTHTWNTTWASLAFAFLDGASD